TFPKQGSEFKLTLEGSYPSPAGDTRQATLDLPRPLNTLDRGGQMSVKVPENLALVMAGKPDEPVRDRHQQTWTVEQAPERVEVAWRPYHPELPVDSLVDIVLDSHQAHVRQRLTF